MKEKIRSLASDTLVYGVFKTAGKFLSFLLTPLYTNFIPVEEVGWIYYIFSIIAFISIVNSFGLETAFFRFYSKTDPKETKRAYSHAFLPILIISTTISAVIFISADYLQSHFEGLENAAGVIRLAALIPFLDAFLLIPYAYLRMKRQAKKFALIQFSLIVIAVFLNIIFVVKLGYGATGVFLSNVLASVVGVILVSKIIIENIEFKFDKKLFFEMLRFGVPTVPASLSTMVLQVSDRIVLNELTDPTSVGIYSVSKKLGITIMMFITIFDYAWRPFYLNNYDDPNAKRIFARVLTYFTMISVGIFLVTCLFIEYIVQIPFIGGKLINPEYWQGLGIIPIILGGYFFNGIFINLASGFHITKRTEFLPLAVGVGAIVNVAINFLLIPRIGYTGAAWATLGSYLISVIVLFFISRKVYPVNYEWRRLILLITLTLIIYFSAVYLVTDFGNLIEIIIRIFALILFLFLLKILGFFTPEELRGIKRVFRKNT